MPAAYADFRLTTIWPTTITVGGTAYKAEGNTTTANLLGFDSGASPTDNLLRYTLSASRLFLVTVAAAMTKDSGGATQGTFMLYKNGSALGLDVEMLCRLGPGSGDPGEAAMTSIVSLTKNDILEIFVTANAPTTVIRMAAAQMSILSIS